MTNERFVRWQSQTIAQLSNALTLLSGLSIAGLGLLFSLLRESTFIPTGMYAALFLFSLAVLLLASLAGVGAVIARLVDFRLTARKVRKGEIEEPITFFGADASDHGRATWRLFWTLAVSFGLGVISGSIVIAHVFLGRIINAVSV